MHCNDWPTALVPTYLKALAAETPALAATRTVLTLHNVAHQGVFPKDVLPILGLGWDEFRVDGIEFYGGLNVLKAGLLAADAVTTVSPTYAREIQTPERGGKLDGILRARGDELVGIVNGVDYAVWNPATDPAVAARYDAEDVANKVRCKGALQKELSLPVDVQAPLVACVGRMVEQKGTDLAAAVTPRLLRATDAQVVFAGDGDPSLVGAVEGAVAKSEGRAVLARSGERDLDSPRLRRGGTSCSSRAGSNRAAWCSSTGSGTGRCPWLMRRAAWWTPSSIATRSSRRAPGSSSASPQRTPCSAPRSERSPLPGTALPRWPSLPRPPRDAALDRGWDRPGKRYEQLYRALTGR